MRKMTSFLSKVLRGEFRDLFEFQSALRSFRSSSYGDSDLTERFFETLPEPKGFVAPKRLAVGAPFFTSDQMLRQFDRADWQHVDPRISSFAAHYIEALRKRGIPMWVHCAFRTRDEQNAAKSRGVSNLSWPYASHCQGKAVDVVHGRYAWNLTKSEWDYLGKIGLDVAAKLGLSIEWGGHWRSPYDPAHWQLSDWDADIQRLSADAPVRATPRYLLRRGG